MRVGEGRGRVDEAVGAGAPARVGRRGRRGVGEMVEGDPGCVTEREDVRLAEVRRAVVVRVGQPVGAQLDAGAHGAPDDERGLVPVRIGSVPGLGPVVVRPDRHHAPRQVARVRQAVGDFILSQVSQVVGIDGPVEAKVLCARRNACHAGEDEPTVVKRLPLGAAVPGLHANAGHLDILILLGALGESLELGDTTGRGADRALFLSRLNTFGAS